MVGFNCLIQTIITHWEGLGVGLFIFFVTMGLSVEYYFSLINWPRKILHPGRSTILWYIIKLSISKQARGHTTHLFLTMGVMWLSDLDFCHLSHPALVDSNQQLWVKMNSFSSKFIIVRMFYHSNSNESRTYPKGCSCS